MIENESKYDVYCEFDIVKHKKTYIDYLEVVILPNGKIEYAVPSHLTKIEMICCEKLKCTRKQLAFEKCPKDMIFDYMSWLLSVCGAISVWNEFYIVGRDCELTQEQERAIKKLKKHGLYKGAIHSTRKCRDAIDYI